MFFLFFFNDKQPHSSVLWANYALCRLINMDQFMEMQLKCNTSKFFTSEMQLQLLYINFLLDNKQHAFRSNSHCCLQIFLWHLSCNSFSGACFELSPQGVVLISQALILTFLEESRSAYICLHQEIPQGRWKKDRCVKFWKNFIWFWQYNFSLSKC